MPKSGREQVFSSQLSLTAYGMFVTTSFGICAKSHIIDLLVNADFLQRMKFQQFYAIQVNAFAIFRSAWVQNAAFPIPVGNMRRRFTALITRRLLRLASAHFMLIIRDMWLQDEVEIDVFVIVYIVRVR